MPPRSTIDLGTAARFVGAGAAGYWGVSPTIFLLGYTGIEAYVIAGHNGTSLWNAPMPSQRFAAVAADGIAAALGYGLGSYLRRRKSTLQVS